MRNLLSVTMEAKKLTPMRTNWKRMLSDFFSIHLDSRRDDQQREHGWWVNLSFQMTVGGGRSTIYSSARNGF